MIPILFNEFHDRGLILFKKEIKSSIVTFAITADQKMII